MKNKKKKLANPLHFAIQQTYRVQIVEDKTKFKRSKEKQNTTKEIKENM